MFTDFAFSFIYFSCNYFYISIFLLNFLLGEFLKLIKDYEVTLPYRVNSEGQFETHILHPEHHTVKRSTQPETVHYHVIVENKTLHLQMKLNDKFTSPGMVVERLKSRFKNVSDSTFVPYWKRKCFFSGKIKDHMTSNVALQVCNGLVSLKI